MAPVKFDDIPKTANEVLSDDYQTSGFQLKAKQKTSWDGAVVTSAFDLFPGKDCSTPAKLTWKLPTPLGTNMFCLDKLEVDKGGKIKVEASSDKVYPSLKAEVKSELADVSKAVVAATYTGVKDLQVKAETKALSPGSFAAEASYATGAVTLGMKCTAATLTCPDVGVRMLSGPYFGSICAREKLSVYSVHGLYKLSDELKCAATYEHGGKKGGAFSLGVAYDVKTGTKVKAKIQQDQSVSCSVKHELCKGFTLLGGAKLNLSSGDASYGLQLSVE
jgi:hypothetical protein